MFTHIQIVENFKKHDFFPTSIRFNFTDSQVNKRLLKFT